MQMDTDNISMVMGPTIVGYSSSEPMAIMSQGPQQSAVMKLLLGLSADYWSIFLAVEQENIFGLKLTPSNPLKTPGHASGRMHTGSTPDCPIFNPPMVSSEVYHGGFGRTPLTGGPVSKRTRSKQLHRDFSRKNTLFQSPMLL